MRSHRKNEKDKKSKSVTLYKKIFHPDSSARILYVSRVSTVA